ncbi:rod shape-determining protein MreC [Bacteroidia bacterium]|nr:rod shape-determining protein MreC [Bacteroidia bacterium]
MQRLLAFIEHNVHIILFVVLQVVCGFLMFYLNPYQQATFTHSAATVTASANQLTANVTGYLDLKDQNIKLQDQVADQFRNSPEAVFHFLEDTLTIKDSNRVALFDIVPVQVVYNTANKGENVFVINKGSNHGIKRNMGVISSEGVAGIVLTTSARYSSVMSLLNLNFSLTPNINGIDYYIPIKWENKHVNILRIKGINKLEEIAVGDRVKTGSSTALFPKGIHIGKVARITTKQSSQYFDLEIETATDFRKLNYAYVVINKDIKSIKALLENVD